MNDKNYEGFEAWVKDRALNSPAGFYPQILHRLNDDHSRYMVSWVDAAWEGWQASRAAVVVEWPNHYDYTNSDVAGAAILDCRTAFQKAMKVKP